MKTSPILLGILLLFGCKSETQTGCELPEVVKYPFTSTLNSLSDLIQKIEVVPLKHKDDFLLGALTYTRHHDSSFYISDPLNSRIIYRFHEDGHFLNTIGSFGKGPGEYLSLGDFYVDDISNDIFIESYPDFRLYRYDKQGKFIGMKSQHYIAESFAKNGNSFWVYGGHNNGYMPERIVRYDTSLNLISKHYPLETHAIHVSTGPVFCQWKDELYTVMGLDPQIYQISRDSIFPIIRFDFGTSAIPPSYWKAENSRQSMEMLLDRSFCNIRNFLANDHYFISEQDEQGGLNATGIWYICAIKHRDSGQWDWIRKAIHEAGLVVDGQSSPSSGSGREWYMNKIQGFAQDGRLMLMLDGMTLESIPEREKALIGNPEVLAHINPETDSFLLLCTLKD